MLYLLNMDEKKELWVAWTRAALSNYDPPEFEDDDDDEELVDDMVSVSTKYADAMLEEYEQRFNEGKARRRKKKPDPDPDDDDDI